MSTEREKLVKAIEIAERYLALVNEKRCKLEVTYKKACGVVDKAIVHADARQKALRDYDAAHK